MWNIKPGTATISFIKRLAKYVEDYVAWLEEVPSLIEHACMHDRM